LSLAFQKQGQPPPYVVFETRSVRLRLQVVAVSRHLGFLARQVIQNAAPQFGLKELPVKDATWRRPIGVIYRKGAYLSPAARRFIEILGVTAKRVLSSEQKYPLHLFRGCMTVILHACCNSAVRA
jgi:DNA-binding transcriptional LysR family regulator